MPGHMVWLYHLQVSCEQQGCPVAECRSMDFSATHGPRSLCDSITMFLSYYVPRKLRISTDLEWRQLLVALRCFHLFCVRRQYVREDDVLMAALYKLREFNLSVIPKRLAQLCQRRWWDDYSLQNRTKNDKGNQLEENTSDGNHASTENGSIVGSDSAINGRGEAMGEERRPEDGKGKEDSNEDDSGDMERDKDRDWDRGKDRGKDRDRDGEIVDEFGFCRYFGADELTVTVEQVMPDGWFIKCEEDDTDAYECDGRVFHRDRDEQQVFLHLPACTARNGMQGMTLTGLQLGFRNGMWRPIPHEDGSCVASAYPPDELFYY